MVDLDEDTIEDDVAEDEPSGSAARARGPNKMGPAQQKMAAKAAKLGRFHISLGTPATARAALPPRYMGPIRDFVDRLDKGDELLAKLGLTERNPKASNEGGTEIIREGIMVAPCAGATRVIVIIGGNTKPYAYHNELCEIPNTHIVLIRDRSRCFSLLGIHRLGMTYEESLDGLKKLFDALGVKKSYFIGVSSGGFAALKMGLDLKADGVMGFAAPVSLNIDDDPEAQLDKYPQLALLYRRARHLGTDMKVAYSSTKPRPSVVLIYGGDHERDRFFAEHMKDIPGITLQPMDGFTQHSVYEALATSDELGPYFDKLLTLQQVT